MKKVLSPSSEKKISKNACKMMIDFSKSVRGRYFSKQSIDEIPMGFSSFSKQ